MTVEESDKISFAQREMTRIIQSYTDWKADKVIVCYGRSNDEMNAWVVIEGKTIPLEELGPNDGVDANKASLGMVINIMKSELDDIPDQNRPKITVITYSNMDGRLQVDDYDDRNYDEALKSIQP